MTRRSGLEVLLRAAGVVEGELKAVEVETGAGFTISARQAEGVNVVYVKKRECCSITKSL